MPLRNWLLPDVTLLRLKASLKVLATGHLNCADKTGTHFFNRNRGAVPQAVELRLDDKVRRFTHLLATYNNECPVAETLSCVDSENARESRVGVRDEMLERILKETSSTEEEKQNPEGHRRFEFGFGGQLYGVEPPTRDSHSSSKRGDFCLLHSKRVAVPDPGKAATASLSNILGAAHTLLQPETLLTGESMKAMKEGNWSSPRVTKRFQGKQLGKARAHAHPGEWAKIVERMHAAGMCVFREAGTVLENSVFGVLKTSNPDGAHRLIFSGDVANKFFDSEAGAVELPNPDVISNLQLRSGSKLYLASSDISQCYNRLKVPEWFHFFLGMPRVWSTEVGEGGKRRRVVPVLTVLPMGIIPAVRLCQEVTLTICRQAGNPRILMHEGTYEISETSSPLDIIYLDDLTALGANCKEVNARRDELAEKCAELGLPTEETKTASAQEGRDGEALGLLFQQNGVLSVTPAYFIRLLSSTEELLFTRRCSPRHLAAVVGSWVYACLLQRPMLSVLSAVYDFTRLSRYDETRCLPAEILRELSMLLDLAPAMCCDLSLSVSGRVYATDASPTGGGVTYRDNVTAHDLSILEETRVRKGWQEKLKGCNRLESGARGILHVSDGFKEFFETCPFKVAIAAGWKREQHINVLELEALLLAVRHARRSPATVLCRVKFGLDSTVALGVARKGRSSSVPLNTVARRLCAHFVWAGVDAEFFWIPTKLMPADEPSRRHGQLFRKASKIPGVP